MLIPGYERGSDLTIINDFYIKPRKDFDTGNYSKDCLTIVYKDNVSGEKKMYEIKEPSYTYYMAKPEYRAQYNRLFINKDQVDSYTCKYNNLLKDIAQRTGNMQFFMNNVESGNRRANEALHKHPDIFASDVHIEDYYRRLFAEQYTNKAVKVTKAFFDIESDTINMAGDFPEMGECPINAVTIIFKDENKVFTFLLEDKNNPQIDDFKAQVKDGSIFKELIPFIVQNVGGLEKFKSMGLDKYEYNILFYDEKDEIKLIQDLFISINTYKPDFVLAWNMAFDIPYIIERIKRLGYSPEDIMCHPDFKNKIVYYFVDERVKDEFSERGDYAQISSYSVFLDQMIQFASRRKSQSAFPSFSLDYIGGAVAKVNKVNYKDICANIGELPRANYKTFVFYNIFDTIVQNCVEVKSQDVEYVFTKCLSNDTRYSKCHRQTVYLTNRGAKEFSSSNFIMGNNYNRGTSAPTTKYPGAFVADPAKLNAYSKIKVCGVPIYVFANAVDFDYKSMYPSELMEFNMAPNTQIGMIEIPDQVNPNENILKDDKWTRSGAFVADFHSHVWLEFFHRWFGLADYRTLFEDIEYYFTHIRKPLMYIENLDEHGYLIPLYDVDEYEKMMNPLTVEEKDQLITVLEAEKNWDRNDMKGLLDYVSGNQHYGT